MTLKTQSPDNKPSGRRRPPRTPKGRQVDPQALSEVQALLLDRPRRRDLLIEHLHLIQDHYGHLSAAHLAALALEMKLAQTEVYEVATFYSHFDVVKEDDTFIVKLDGSNSGISFDVDGSLILQSRGHVAPLGALQHGDQLRLLAHGGAVLLLDDNFFFHAGPP